MILEIKYIYNSIDDLYLAAREIQHLSTELFKDDALEKRFENDYFWSSWNCLPKLRKDIHLVMAVSSQNKECHTIKLQETLPVTIASLAAHILSVIDEHELCELDDQWMKI